jgi:hypothetical protein
LLKACPHCRGDLVFEQDRACGDFTCVQCGHILSAAQERALGYRVTTLGPLHVYAGSCTSRRATQEAAPRYDSRNSRGAPRHANE